MSKRNKSYWRKRNEQWMKSQDVRDNRFFASLRKDYQRTAKEIEKDIASYFASYGKDDVIEFRVLLQDLSKKDRDLLFQDMDSFAKKYPEYEHLMPVRKSVYKLNRMQGLHYSTQMKLLELGAIEQKELQAYLTSVYGANYMNVMKELGLGEVFDSISDNVIKQTIRRRWVNNENFSNRIWGNKDKLLNHLTTKFRDGIARGDSYANMSKAIMERFSVAEYDARRLIWTESSFVLNQSHMKAYKDIGVKEYQIDAIIDSRTSDICKSMDGKVFEFKDAVVGETFPPFHTFCRSTYTSHNLDDLLNKAEKKKG